MGAKQYRYPNGLTLVVDPAKELRSVTLGAWVKTGTRNEEMCDHGVAHLLEHMMFKGHPGLTSKQISKAIDRVGGDFNAFTSRENTCFHFFLPKSELDLGAKLFKEILYKSAFSHRELEKEKQVVLQEIASVREQPEEEVFDLFIETIFPDHPLGRSITGTVESVSGMSRARLVRFFHQHYRPQNMIIAIAGGVSFDHAKRIFSDLGTDVWPGRGSDVATVPKLGMEPPTQTRSGTFWKIAPIEQGHLVWGISAPVTTLAERLAALLIQQWWGGGMSSVLFDEIRERRGWAYTIYASHLPFQDTHWMTVYAGVNPDCAFTVKRRIESTLKRVTQKGLSSVDLKRLQQSLIYQYELSLESSESRMMTLANQALLGRSPLTLKSYKEVIHALTPAQVNALAQKWLKGVKPTFVGLGPKPPKSEVNALGATSVSWIDEGSAKAGWPLSRRHRKKL